MAKIEVPDDTAAFQKKQREANGLTLQEWIKQREEAVERGELPDRSITEEILEIMKDLSPEELAAMHEDGASQHDHYIYGWPKRKDV